MKGTAESALEMASFPFPLHNLHAYFGCKRCILWQLPSELPKNGADHKIISFSPSTNSQQQKKGVVVILYSRPICQGEGTRPTELPKYLEGNSYRSQLEVKESLKLAGRKTNFLYLPLVCLTPADCSSSPSHQKQSSWNSSLMQLQRD